MKAKRVLSYGNRSDIITVELENGITVNAIAANCINSGKVTVIKQRNLYFVWGGNPPTLVLSGKKLGISREEIATEEEEVILPFVALFTPNVQLGGDRNQIILQSFEPVTIGGVNKVEADFIAVWLSDQIIVDQSGNQSFLGLPSIFNTFPPEWIGAGILALNFIPLYPAPNLEENITGDELPEVVVPPLYPSAQEYPFLGDIDGVTTLTQSEDGYSYTEIETYFFDYVQSGTAGVDNPLPAQPTAFCTPGNDGDIEILVYRLDTEFTYLKTVNIELTGNAGVFFNNQFFGSDHTETYNETFSYTQTPARFRTTSTYQCIGILSSWQPTVNRIGVWDGQSETTDFDSTTIINEPEWDKPITTLATRKQKHLRNEIVTRDAVFDVPAENWSINPFDFSFTFEVIGTETEAVTTIITEEKTTPTTLLISGDGNSAIFSEENKTLDFDLVSDRVRSISRLNANNITIENGVTSHLETTIVTQSNNNSLFLIVANSSTDIDLESSIFFSITTETNISLGTLTLSNDSLAPIFSDSLTKITSYEKVEDKVLNNVNFNNVVETPNPIWDNIENETYFVLYQGSRYIGNILTYTFNDNPNTELSIDIVREITSITINLSSVSSYPQGLTNDNEILIYTAGNCALLLRDRLLTEGFKTHCNLVNSTLYFSKSILNDPSLAEQIAEVYQIGNVVTQEAPVSGQFIPLSNPGTIISTSYYPI